MYAVSSEFHSAAISGAKQKAVLVFGDAVLTGDDIASNGGLKYTDPFCAQQDLTIGLCPSASVDISLMNKEAALDTFTFGEFTAYLGVNTLSGAYTPTSGATATLPINGSYTVSIHDTAPYVRIGGVGCTNQPDFIPRAILVLDGDLYVVSAIGEYFKYTLSLGVTWESLATSTWSEMASSTWGSFLDTGSSGAAITVNDIMEQKGVAWAAANTSAIFGSNVLREYFTDGTYDEYEMCPLGTFYADRPATVRKSVVKFTAYDGMDKFDVDVTDWFAGLTYPITLLEIFSGLCAEVGVVTSTTTFLNSSHSYTEAPFVSMSLTGRKLLKYVAEAACAEAKFNRDNVLQLQWFTSTGRTVAAGSVFTGAVAEYSVAVIDKLQVQAQTTDVGVVIGTGTNAYILLANPLIVGENDADVRAFATPISTRLFAFSAFAPASFRMIGDWSYQSGDIVDVVYDGSTYSVPIYTQVITWNSGCRQTINSTGGALRDVNSVTNREEFLAAQKQTLIEKTVDGITVTVTDTTARVESNESQISQLADSLTTRVTQTVFDAALADKADSADVDARFTSVVEQTSQDITNTFSVVQGNVDALSGDFDDYVSQVSVYQRFSEAGMELGRSDSPFTMLLSNTQLSFLQSSVILAYFANNKMYVSEAEMDKATIAGFEWAETTGGTGLKWRG